MAVKMCKDGDLKFLKACELAKIPPTRRQRRKWLERRGAAYSKRLEAEEALKG